MKSLTYQEDIEERILLIRGHKVMLDKDLAKLYGVPTKRLNEQLKRNTKRFPADFMFQLSWQEIRSLRSQDATLKRGQHIKYRIHAFTEQGVAMLSSVLNSERAIQVNIAIMRVFVKMRQIISAHKELALKLSLLEQKIEKHDTEIQAIFEAIHQLMVPPEKPKRRVGFHDS
ncbi:MAG: ORF6N domain-containing protein [Omnitrophica bacterium]|nr:ORF6N domain-containing protein [Candidatus Omnitrophota bacterium]